MAKPDYRKQLIGSLIAAVVIAVLAIALVTVKIGPGLDATELRERQDLIEERQDAQEERQEEQQDNSGSG